jgi:hypothetical protein
MKPGGTQQKKIGIEARLTLVLRWRAPVTDALPPAPPANWWPWPAITGSPTSNHRLNWRSPKRHSRQVTQPEAQARRLGALPRRSRPRISLIPRGARRSCWPRHY